MSTAAPSVEVKRTDLNPCTVLLEVTCSPDQVEAGFQRASKAFSKKVRVPGFRPGTAPQSVIEKLVDPQELARAAADEIIKDSLKKALDKEGVKPDNSPAVTVTKFDRTSCEYSAKVPLAPKVTLGDYKGLRVERPPVEVTDEEVERQIEELRRRKGKREAVTGRGIEPGDMAVVNLRVAGEEGEGKTFMVIAGQTFPDLDGALHGMASEELKHAKLAFPSTFQEKEWAGKTLEATVTVRSVSTTEAPELDDAFAQSFKATNVGDLKEKVRESLVRAKEDIAQEMVNEQLFDQLLANSEVQVADTTWEQVTNQRLQELAQGLAQENKTLEDYAKEKGMTMDELVAAQQAESKTHVQRAVLIEHIFKAEGLKVDQNDANRHFLQIAAENRVPQEQLTKFAKRYGGAIRNEILFRAMHAKVLDVLNSNAVQGGSAGAQGSSKSKKRTQQQ